MKYLAAIFLSLSLTLLNFTLHTSESVDTVLNTKSHELDSKRIESMVTLHKENFAFSKRPFTSFITEKTSDLFSIEIATSFVITSYLFLFLGTFLLYLLSIEFNQSHQFALFSLLIFHLCFSVFFAFFSPIYSYDEFIQYTLLFLSLYFFKRNAWFLFIITLSLAAIARESSLFIIPALFFYFSIQKGSSSMNSVKRSIILALPALLYSVYLLLFISYNDIGSAGNKDLASRISGFFNNFSSYTRAIESITSFILVLGLPLYLILMKKRFGQKIKPEYKSNIRAFLLTLVLNSIIVFLFTNAREARLFAIPLFFLWPIFMSVFGDDFRLVFSLKNFNRIVESWKRLILTTILLLIAYYFSTAIYKSSLGQSDFHYFNEYLFIMLLFMAIHFVLRISSKSIVERASDN